MFYEKLVHVMPTFQTSGAMTAIHDIERKLSLYLLTITLINGGPGIVAVPLLDALRTICLHIDGLGGLADFFGERHSETVAEGDPESQTIDDGLMLDRCLALQDRGGLLEKLTAPVPQTIGEHREMQAVVRAPLEGIYSNSIEEEHRKGNEC